MLRDCGILNGLGFAGAFLCLLHSQYYFLSRLSQGIPSLLVYGRDRQEQCRSIIGEKKLGTGGLEQGREWLPAKEPKRKIKAQDTEAK